jgi:hypothetical protein
MGKGIILNCDLWDEDDSYDFVLTTKHAALRAACLVVRYCGLWKSFFAIIISPLRGLKKS